MIPPSSNRPPLYLMHGMWCTGDTLQSLANLLRDEGFRVDAPTLPDHSVDLDRYGQRRLGRASLLEGGLLAQIVASRIPASGVVLLAPAAPAGFNLIQPCSTIATGHVLAKYAFWRRTHKPPRIFADYGLFHRLPRAERAKAYKEIVWESGRAYSEIVFWFWDKHRASAVDPRHLMAPMLVLSAEHDRILTPRVVERVAAFYPQAQYEELANLGHMMFAEPGGEVVADRVLAWLEEMSLFGSDRSRANELLEAPLPGTKEIAA